MAGFLGWLGRLFGVRAAVADTVADELSDERDGADDDGGDEDASDDGDGGGNVGPGDAGADAREGEEERAHDDGGDGYWWLTVREKPPVVEFEAIDLRRVYTDFSGHVASGAFGIIEIPSNIMRIMSILGKPDFTYHEVTDLISRSPVLAGEFLKMANSSLYGRGVKISDLRVALPRLGQRQVKGMLYLNSTRMAVADQPVFNQVATEIVNHCNAVGKIAGYLAHRYYPDPDSAFLAGLLHDVGKLAILKELGDRFDLPAEAAAGLTEDSFAEILPPLHEAVGTHLAQHWELDDEVAAAISHHHTLDDVEVLDDHSERQYLSALINVSDTMARVLGKGRWIGDVNLFGMTSAKELGLEGDRGTVEFLKPIPELLAHDG